MVILIRVIYVNVFVPWLGTDEPAIGVQCAGIYNIEIAKQEYK